MHRTKTERLKDDLIGKAVFSLLKENAPVNFSSLIARLHRMAENELEPEKGRALTASIKEISARIRGGQSDSTVIPGMPESYRNTDKKH